MPTSRPCVMRLASFIALIITIVASGSKARMRRLVSMPLASGRFMSIVTAAGRVSLYFSTASAALLATAQTSKPAFLRMPSSIAWLTRESSTIMILILFTKLTLFFPSNKILPEKRTYSLILSYRPKSLKD